MDIEFEVGEECAGGYGGEVVVGLRMGVQGGDRVQTMIVRTTNRWA